MQTGKKINQISNRLRRRSRAIQETIGISGAQGNILNYILVESQNRSVYQKDIEQEFGLRPSTATETLKSLEKNGLIKRETDPNDGRYKKIVFTEKAEQIEAVLKSEIEESEMILLQGVTEEERQEFLRIAEKMLQNLDTFPVNTVKKNAGRKKQQGGRTDENIGRIINELKRLGLFKGVKSRCEDGNTKRDQQSGHGCLQYGRYLFCWTDWGSTAGSSGQSDQSDIYFTDGICKYVWYGWKCRCIYGDGRKK